jgi:CheY-like chemotaxis protein
MTILLVEDDENKREDVMDVIRKVVPNAITIEARSLQSAIDTIQKHAFNFIIVDMTMPMYDISGHEDGGHPQAYGGRELLRHLERSGNTSPCVVLTQFDRFGEGADESTLAEVDRDLRKRHQFYLGSIFFNVVDAAWQHELETIIRRTGLVG